MSAGVPWFPRNLRRFAGQAADLRAGWSYVVLEELVDGTALLLRWPWPLADARGRLYWQPEDDEGVVEACIPAMALEEQLYRPSRLQRSPRLGDTFAARDADGAGWSAPGKVTDVRELFPAEVVDVSADARMAAKLAYQGSLVSPVAKEDVEPELVREAVAERRRLPARQLVTGDGQGEAGGQGGPR